MKLLASLTSPFVRKVRIVLAEKKLEVDLKIENVWAPDCKVQEINPLGKVPCLVTEDGGALFDSRVIVEYLDTLSPVSRLIPPGGRERAAVKCWEALADGTLDASFGNGGSVVEALSTGTDLIARIAVLPDGRYQALARSGSGAAGTSCLMMFTSSGTLDNSFSGDGKLFNLFAAAAPQGVADLAVRADGSVLALGGGAGEVKVVAVQNNGALDSGFGSGGTAVVSAGTALHVRPGGSILVHGPLTTGGVFTLHSTRLLPSGTVDPAYGSGGTFSFSDAALTATSAPSKPLFYPDGRYMVGWRHRDPITDEIDGAITWFEANGGVAAVGTVLTDLGPQDNDQDEVTALAMAPDGDILAACSYIDDFRRLVVARYNGDLLTTGIAPELRALLITAFPIPASTEMRLSLPDGVVITGVLLLDGACRRVPAPVSIRGGNASVDVQQLASGIYIAEVMAEGRVHRHRVQVIR